MASSDVPDYILWLIWTFLRGAPPIQRNSYSSAPTFESEDMLEEFMEESQVVFAPGLSDAVQSAAPPSISYFKALPNDGKAKWALYGLVLEKDGCRSKFYLGTGTHSTGGVIPRWKDYDLKINLPRLVKDAIDQGFVITHKCLLCWSPIPDPASRFQRRDLFLTPEAVFGIVLGAMQSETPDPRLPDICPWPRKLFTYDGCCTHLAWGEGLREGGAVGLAPHEMEAYEARTKLEKSEKRSKAYFAAKRHNFEVWKATRRLYESRRDPKEQKASKKKTRLKNLTTRKYACEVCNVAFGQKADLDAHNLTKKHINNVNGVVRTPCVRTLRQNAANIAAKTHYDSICDVAFGTASELKAHLRSAEHIEQAALHEEDFDVEEDPDVGEDLDVLDDVQKTLDHRSDPQYQAAQSRDREQAARRAANNIAAKKFHCGICDKSFVGKHFLERHLKGKKHRKNAALAALPAEHPPSPAAEKLARRREEDARKKSANIAARLFHCGTCNQSFGTKAILAIHFGTKKHKEHAAVMPSNG